MLFLISSKIYKHVHKTTSFSRLILGLILLLAISCTKKNPLNQSVVPLFSDTVIIGRVINNTVIGLSIIIIQYNQGNTQVTDSNGNFHFILTVPQTVLLMTSF